MSKQLYPDYFNPYPYGDDFILKVNTAKLARYIQTHLWYFFMRAGKRIMPFFYSDGVYKQYLDTEMKAQILNLINVNTGDTRKEVRTKDVEEVYKLLQFDELAYRNADELNSVETVINFRDGMLRLGNMEMYDHDTSLISTIQLPVSWEACRNAGDCPVFREYLSRLVNGDEALIKLIMEFCGLTFSNIFGYRTKKALFLTGKKDTGKSVLFSFLSNIIGEENTAVTDFANLSMNRFAGAELWGKRLAGSPDMGSAVITDTSVFKQLSGGDTLRVEFKNADVFTDRFRGTLLFCGNNMPAFTGNIGAETYERMIIIKCENPIPHKEQDPFFLTRLMEEKEAVIFACVNALQDFIARGYKFDVPEVCRKNSEIYRLETDNVREFLNEFAVIRSADDPYTDGYTETMVYHTYNNWAKTCGYFPYNKSLFLQSAARYYSCSSAESLKMRKMSGRFLRFTLNNDGKAFSA